MSVIITPVITAASVAHFRNESTRSSVSSMLSLSISSKVFSSVSSAWYRAICSTSAATSAGDNSSRGSIGSSSKSPADSPKGGSCLLDIQYPSLIGGKNTRGCATSYNGLLRPAKGEHAQRATYSRPVSTSGGPQTRSSVQERRSWRPWLIQVPAEQLQVGVDFRKPNRLPGVPRYDRSQPMLVPRGRQGNAAQRIRGYRQHGLVRVLLCVSHPRRLRGALAQLTRTLALEAIEHGIRVNAVGAATSSPTPLMAWSATARVVLPSTAKPRPLAVLRSRRKLPRLSPFSPRTAQAPWSARWSWPMAA